MDGVLPPVLLLLVGHYASLLGYVYGRGCSSRSAEVTPRAASAKVDLEYGSFGSLPEKEQISVLMRDDERLESMDPLDSKMLENHDAILELLKVRA